MACEYKLKAVVTARFHAKLLFSKLALGRCNYVHMEKHYIASLSDSEVIHEYKALNDLPSLLWACIREESRSFHS